MFILQTSAQGQANLLKVAKKNNARILFASTSEVYGDPLVHPQVESYWGNVNPIGPRSCYDEAKRFSEAITMAYLRTQSVQSRIIRIFNTYGPRMRAEDGRVVPNFCMQALRGEPLTVYGQGQQTRSFCYVSDLVEGILRVFQSDYTLPVNLGNPNEITIREFAERTIALSGKKLAIREEPLPQDDPKTRRPDITLVKKLTGWEPKVDLATGLAATYAYFQTQVHAETRPTGSAPEKTVSP
ncbi:GDP-mannose 4,6-dehydratase [bacterium]|nr:GDP-mannose 4,6-dehydratase [bacterium]